MSALLVVRVVGLATVQRAFGQPGWRAHGVPPGGALVPAWLLAANRAVGAPLDAAGIEYTGSLEVEALAPVALCAAGRRRTLEAGQRLFLPAPSPAGVAYAALAGGVAARGLVPRALAPGDRLAVAGPPGPPEHVSLAPLDPTAPVCLVPGPDLDAFAADALAAVVRTAWTIAASGRSGLRLDGAPIVRVDTDGRRSAPVVRGAVQVPADGRPLVLGPDGPTIGGYPVLGTLVRTDAEALAARAPGATVRFFIQA